MYHAPMSDRSALPAGDRRASPGVSVEGIAHAYAGRPALRGVDLVVPEGAMVAVLGPNGGGKSTLFRILATLLRPDAGRALVCGHDTVREAPAVRACLGVVFQSPAVDRLLTVRENLETHALLYGVGRGRRQAIAAMLERLGLLERASDRAGTLSGGLLRRVEIAKALLHRPRLLLLDEPSTGLDPGARATLWEELRALRRDLGVTVLFTTHLMDEAEDCDRVAILCAGRVAVEGAPADLTAAIGGEVLVIVPRGGAAGARAEVERITGAAVTEVDHTLRLEAPGAHLLVPRIIEALPGRIEAVTVGRPTLADVFLRHAGRPLGEAETR
jgi:ABC-2 type transport system ATP-binding protein